MSPVCAHHHGDAFNRSVAQIELSAKSMGDFLCASLIPDQIARRRKNHRLKTEGVILAHNNFQARDSDLPGDHLSELLCSDVFSNHGEIPRFNRLQQSDREFLKDSSTNMVNHEAVQIRFDIADQAANARRTTAESNCSPIAVNREPLTSPILFSVRMATRSQRSVDTPSASIAIARCSLTSRSSQEIPSISHLGPKIPGLMTGCKS
ncbi:MAG: hypothetical protein P4M05_06500 [Bradyrhizobium sp.]|nr:hypothetical protein [Bradyrhizobium sp.]